MICNLRGGNGSGKSTVYRWLLDNHEREEISFPNFRTANVKKPSLWRLHGDMYMIGRWQSGADGIGFAALIDLVKTLSQRGHVFFENVLVSGNVSTFLPVRKELSDQRWIWATLDTPLETCLERIQLRNGGKPVKEGTIATHHKRVKRYAQDLIDLGEEAIWIDHTRSIEHVHSILVDAGWDCGRQHDHF
jgi:predicted ABC-type ATPase